MFFGEGAIDPKKNAQVYKLYAFREIDDTLAKKSLKVFGKEFEG